MQNELILRLATAFNESCKREDFNPTRVLAFEMGYKQAVDDLRTFCIKKVEDFVGAEIAATNKEHHARLVGRREAFTELAEGLVVK